MQGVNWLARGRPATVAFLTLWLSVQCYIEMGGGWRHQGDFLQHWGFEADDFGSWRRGTWLTYAFLHVNWWHFILNLLIWTRLAFKIEWMLGSLWLVRVTLLSIVAAALAHALAGMPSHGALIGASGASMGILVFVAVIDPDAHVLRGLRLRMRSLAIGLMTTEMILLILQLCFVLRTDTANSLVDSVELGGTAELLKQWLSQSWLIGHACHVGGGVMGWGLAQWLMRPRLNLKDLQRMRAKNSLRQ